MLAAAVAESLRTMVREEVSAAVAALAPRDPTLPITAEELCTRWKIKGKDLRQKLHNLNRRIADQCLNLVPLDGSKGKRALYLFADVVKVEGGGK